MKKRSEVNPSDCWDIKKIIPDEKTYDELIKTVKESSQKIVSLKGHILDTSKTLSEYLSVSKKEELALEKLVLYTYFLYDVDTTNNQNKAKKMAIEALENDVRLNESFVISEFMEKDLDYVKSILEDDSYTLYFERLYYDKKRILSEAEEKIITLAYSAFGSSSDTFKSLDTADALFGVVKDDEGKKVELTHYNYGELLESKKQSTRKKVFQTYYQFYEKHKNTYASLLKGRYEELEFTRTIRKYDTALEMALDNTRVNPLVYENLINNVHHYNDINVRFQKLKRKKLNLKEYHLYDTYTPIVNGITTKYTKDEAIELITKALEPLGKDYLNHFLSVFKSQSVDLYPNVGKSSGAYQWGGYETNAYVLLNFNGTFDSVSTMAHELGHAVHSLYSKENNPYEYYNYEIFLAEIASTVNETLLSFYMLEHSQNKEEKIYFLTEFLDKVKATIYRQTMFAEFESIMSKKCQDKESLTEEVFSETYYNLNKEYFKDSVVIDDEIRYEWMRISHFYRPFYVYQYATGLICAICIVNDILTKDNFTEKYLNFLKSGSSKDVLDILKIVDIDLTDNEPFVKAFNFIEKKVKELEELLEVK